LDIEGPTQVIQAADYDEAGTKLSELRTGIVKLLMGLTFGGHDAALSK